MITEFKLAVKSSAIGRLLYPIVGKMYRWYIVPVRRHRLHKKGYECLNEIIQISNKEGFRVIPIYGTMLGFVRDGGFIPHDDDIDLALFPGKDPREIAMSLVNNYGFEFIQALSYHGNITELTMAYKKVHVDFFLIEDTGEDMRMAAYNWIQGAGYTDPRQNSVRYFVHPRMTEFKKLEVHGVVVDIPTNYEDVLYADYGKGWRVPDPNFVDANEPGEVKMPDFGYTVTWEDLVNNNIEK